MHLQAQQRLQEEGCVVDIRKLHEKAHPPTTIIYSKRPLELLHMDLFGPPSFDSLGVESIAW